MANKVKLRKLFVNYSKDGYIVIEAEGKPQWQYLYYDEEEAINRYKHQVGIENEELDIIREGKGEQV